MCRSLDFNLIYFIFLVTSFGWSRIHSAEHTYLINAVGSNSFITTKYCYSSLPSPRCFLRPQKVRPRQSGSQRSPGRRGGLILGSQNVGQAEMAKLISQKSLCYDSPGRQRCHALIPEPHSPTVSLVHVPQFQFNPILHPSWPRIFYFLHKIFLCAQVSALISSFFSFALPMVLNVFVFGCNFLS